MLLRLNGIFTQDLWSKMSNKNIHWTKMTIPYSQKCPAAMVKNVLWLWTKMTIGLDKNDQSNIKL